MVVMGGVKKMAEKEKKKLSAYNSNSMLHAMEISEKVASLETRR